MTVMTTGIAREREFTEADLAALPDDGRLHELVGGVLLLASRDGSPISKEEWAAMESPNARRVELVDGVVVMTPAPGTRHQRAVLELAVLLRAACPPDLEVFVAPLDVDAGHTTVVQPDVLVVPRQSGERLADVPLLVVEVRSPATARYDDVVKRRVYAANGVLSYWLVDPYAPSVTVLELDGGRYAERAAVAGDEEAAVTAPFPVTLRPSALQ